MNALTIPHNNVDDLDAARQEVNGIMALADAEDRELTETELTTVMSFRNRERVQLEGLIGSDVIDHVTI